MLRQWERLTIGAFEEDCELIGFMRALVEDLVFQLLGEASSGTDEECVALVCIGRSGGSWLGAGGRSLVVARFYCHLFVQGL